MSVSIDQSIHPISTAGVRQAEPRAERTAEIDSLRQQMLRETETYLARRLSRLGEKDRFSVQAVTLIREVSPC
ncbi:MAG: hypothetical protein AAGE65_14200 [Planctomycetota bacterium]